MTQEELDKLLVEMVRKSIPIPTNKAEPVYRIIVDVTEKEYRMLKRKLQSMR